MKKTYGVSLNDRDPTQARIMAEINSRHNDSGAIREMLAEYFAMLDYGQEVVEENRQLKMDLAYARQHGGGATRTPQDLPEGVEVGTAQPPDAIPLSDFFKNAVIKAAKPGLRLDEVKNGDTTGAPDSGPG